jgi:ligand-binding sensor domain-containing protein/two-component sensor histidine kinase
MLTDTLRDGLITRVYSILSITLVMSLAWSAYGAQPKLTKSPLSDLLQQPTVSAIYRDRDGILWIGTEQGLHRYDGANLTIFNSASGNKNRIPDSEIKDIGEDSDGNLFVATSNGTLLKWDRKVAAFKSIISPKSVAETKLVRLLLTMNGSVWLLSRKQLRLYDPISEIVAEWVDNIELLKIVGTPRDIVEDGSGNIWVAGNLGIVCLLLEQKSLLAIDVTTLGLPENSSLTALEALQDNRLLIGTDTGQVAIWDINSGASFATEKLGEDSHTYISQFLQYDDQLLIGTDRGLYLSDRELSHFDDIGIRSAELSNPNIYSLFQDGKYIWIGTIGGLDILSFSPFELFNANNSGIPNDILSFEEDVDGQFWIGTYDGLYLYNGNTRTHGKFVTQNNSVNIDQRVATIAARENTLWLGLIRGGLEIVNTISGHQKHHNMARKSDAGITKIIVIAGSQDMLIATYDHGLFRITNDHTVSYYENGALPQSSITALFQSKTGIILAASESKLYQHSPETDLYRRMPIEFGLGEKHPLIYSFGQTSNNDILIGTKDHGIFRWARKNQLSKNMEIQPFGIREDLKHSTIYGIESDLEGNVWCSTENGIVKLDPRGQLIKRFTVADGLQGSDFTLGASFTSKAGLIYFGGMNGYNRFDPTQIDIDSSASAMRLTGIDLPRQDNRDLGELTELKSLQLTHNDHFVTFQFSVLDFIDAEKNLFRYKLENFDAEWVENGTRNTATYTNLPAGDYVLRVQGANSSGVWNREGITLGVDVLPAPWYSWWAYLIYSVGFAFLVWGLLRIYRSYAIDRESAQMARDMFEAENRADDEMQEQLELQDEMVLSSYQHNLTTLSLISDCITCRSASLPDEVKRKLTDSSIRRIAALSSLEDCLSYQAGGPVANLQKYTNGIFAELLKDAPLKPETIVTIIEVSDMPIPIELASPISIILYEVLENSVQHAFKQDSLANYIQVTLSAEKDIEAAADFLNLSFNDNGVGVPDKIEELASEDSGIAIVESIVSKLGGSLNFSGKGGTRVSIKIPYDA